MLSLRLKSTRKQPAETTKGIAWEVSSLLGRYILNRLPAIFFGLGGGGGEGGRSNTKRVFFSTLYLITDSFISKNRAVTRIRPSFVYISSLARHIFHSLKAID